MSYNNDPFFNAFLECLRQIHFNQINLKQNTLQHESSIEVSKATFDLIMALKKLKPAYQQDAMVKSMLQIAIAMNIIT